MAGRTGDRSLGRFIARRREDLGLEQVELAERLGWSVGTQRRIEQGHRALRNDGELILLARELRLAEETLRRAAGADNAIAGSLPGGPPTGLGHETVAAIVRLIPPEQRRELRALLDEIESEPAGRDR